MEYHWDVYKLSLRLGEAQLGKCLWHVHLDLSSDCRNPCKTVEIVAHSCHTLGDMGIPGACWSVSDSGISERPCLKIRVTEHLASTSGLHTHMHVCMLVSSHTEHFFKKLLWKKKFHAILAEKTEVQNSIVSPTSASSINILSEQNVLKTCPDNL